MKKRKLLKINTITELGYQLGLPEAFLLNTIQNIDNYYKQFTKKDKKGKSRTFYTANNQLKAVFLVDQLSRMPQFMSEISTLRTMISRIFFQV